MTATDFDTPSVFVSAPCTPEIYSLGLALGANAEQKTGLVTRAAALYMGPVRCEDS